MEQLSERDVRIQKIEKMKNLWVVPFAQHFDKEQSIKKIVDEYSNKEMREIEVIIPSPEKQIKTAWRLMLYRSFGKLSFWTIMDGSEKIQVMFHRDNCKIDISTSADEPKLVDSLWEWEEAMTAYKFMEKIVDIWDFIGVTGEVFKTHKWELTIFVSEFKFLSK